MDTTTKKAIGYIRVSTDDQNNSVEAQMDRIKSYASYNKIELVDVLVDEGVSGGKNIEDRQSGAKIFEAIKSKSINCVVATKLDRLFRSTINALTTVELWDKNGISLNLSDMGGVSLDTSTANGRFVFTLLASSAQYERDKTSERVKDICNHKKSALKVYSSAPLGFRVVNRVKDYDGVIVQPGELIENKEEMKVVKTIFKLDNEGWSMGRIAKKLNEDGVSTKTGAEFYPSTISHILKNDIYTSIIK